MENQSKIRVSSIIFIALFCAVLSCVVGTAIPSKVGVAFPDWLDVGKKSSSLENRYYQGLPDVSIRAFVSSVFQEDAEKYLADHVPMRDELLLGNAKLQRTGIQCANLLCGYNVYPTYYGSEYAVDEENRAIVPIAYQVTDEAREAMTLLAEAINASAETHPKVHFAIDQLFEAHVSNYNPTWRLVSGTYSEEIFADSLSSHLNEGVAVLWDPISSSEEFSTQWFKTEHHWKLERALAAYNLIAKEFDLCLMDYAGAEEVRETWYGANARKGLCLDYSDDFWDIPISFPDLSTLVDGRRVSYNAWSKERKLEKENPFDGYDAWYSFAPSSNPLVLENGGENNGKTCLVIGQSYMRPLEPYIASNYQKTVFVDVVNVRTSKTLDWYLDEYGVDDCVIQFGMAAYDYVYDRSPSLLGITD